MPLKEPKSYFTPNPRFTRLGKTRICLIKHILEKNRSSVRPYQRFTLTRVWALYQTSNVHGHSLLLFPVDNRKQILLSVVSHCTCVTQSKAIYIIKHAEITK